MADSREAGLALLQSRLALIPRLQQRTLEKPPHGSACQAMVITVVAGFPAPSNFGWLRLTQRRDFCRNAFLSSTARCAEVHPCESRPVGVIVAFAAR